jgi:hypothetical protein
LVGGRWTAGNRPEPTRANGRGWICNVVSASRSRRGAGQCVCPRERCGGAWSAGRARGRERGGPTRSHPEPDRDPPQRRRVLGERFPGRRGRRGSAPRPPPPHTNTHRGVEQWQLVGLITQRSGVRIPPPPPVVQTLAVSTSLTAFRFNGSSQKLRLIGCAHASTANRSELRHPELCRASLSRTERGAQLGGSRDNVDGRRSTSHHDAHLEARTCLPPYPLTALPSTLTLPLQSA